MKLPILFALLTALCWGVYGPALAQCRTALGSPFKPYVMLGVAYLIWAILGGLLGMQYKGDPFTFSGRGVTWGFIAGTLGAWGALTVTLAMFSGGSKAPHVVMPIVFGGAVVVTALVSWWRTKPEHAASPWLWASIAGVVICAALVAYHTPQERPAGKPATAVKGA